jgi:large subunit ribosomal protein L25
MLKQLLMFNRSIVNRHVAKQAVNHKSKRLICHLAGSNNIFSPSLVTAISNNSNNNSSSSSSNKNNNNARFYKGNKKRSYQYFSTMTSPVNNEEGEFSFEFRETDLEYSKIPYAERIIKVRYRTEEEEGKYAVSALRERGEIPGTLFGGPRFQKSSLPDSSESQPNDRRNICVLNIVDLARDLRMHGLSFFCLPFQLEIEGEEDKENIPVVATGMQTHPTTRELLSLNFLRVEPEGYKQKPKVKIPISYIDEDRCPGLKLGGYLNQAKRSLTVRIGDSDDYDKVPSRIIISLLECGANAKIKTGRIDIPDDCNVHVLDSPKTHLASIIGRKGKAASVEEDTNDDFAI